MEIIQSGELRRIGYENTDDVRASRLFQGIFGVGASFSLLPGITQTNVSSPGLFALGSKTAFTWYANGARTLDDLLAGKGGIKLTSQQKIGIRFYDGRIANSFWWSILSCLIDINERMPRDEAEDIFKKIQSICVCLC
jgi:DNA polymerase lambda